MNWHSFLTALPTAVSGAFFATTHLTFASAMARKRESKIPSPAPRVSILKPVAGRDEELLENLATFVDLDYPDYELLLGTSSLDAASVPVIQAFLAANPGLPARLVITSPARGAVRNPKVAQLIDLARAATGSVLVVSDANIRVRKSYLRSLVSTLSRPGVGLVSSVVIGAGERTLAAALDSAQLGAYVAPSVATAHALNLWPITVGKSMAMRACDLAAVGGFEGVADVLAEDDVLGRRFHARGQGVELSFDPVENHAAHATWTSLIDRHARWAMIRRSLTPLGFAFELLLSPLLVAAAVAVVAPSRVAFAALACSLVLMWAGALLSLTRARSPHALALAALEPLRVTTMSLCWALGAVRRKVVWHGNVFSLAAGSKLRPAAGRTPTLETASLVSGGLVARFATLLRSLLTGGAASLADVAALAFAVGVLHASPSSASAPALLVGAAVQFFGNRYFAFRAARAPIANQAVLFVAAEAITMGLNAGLYQAVASRVPLTLTTAVVARVVTTNLVFLLWSYPVWKRVFRPAIAGSPASARALRVAPRR